MHTEIDIYSRFSLYNVILFYMKVSEIILLLLILPVTILYMSISLQPKGEKKAFVLHNRYLLYNIISFSVNALYSVVNTSYIYQTLYNENFKSEYRY